MRAIVTVRPDTDRVPDGWANWQTGITDNEAVEMTAQSRAALGEPRLADDGGPLATLLVGPPRRVLASSALENVPAAHAVVVQSAVPDGFGSGAHTVIHSRRMGAVVGEPLAGGVSDDGLRSIEGLIQPADADDGGPVAEADCRAWYAAHAVDVRRAGWRLAGLGVRLVPAAKAAAGNVDGSDPRSYLTVAREGAGGDVPAGDTRADAADGYAASWHPRLICLDRRSYALCVRAAHLLPFVRDADLGTRSVAVPDGDAGTAPPRELSPDVDRGVFWGGTATWQAVHY